MMAQIVENAFLVLALTLKTGFQIFGSQGSVDFADDKTIAEVKAKYAIK